MTDQDKLFYTKNINWNSKKHEKIRDIARNYDKIKGFRNLLRHYNLKLSYNGASITDLKGSILWTCSYYND